MTQDTSATRVQTLVGAGIILTGAGLAAGAVGIPSNAGYSGVGPNFLPWLVAISLMVCGALIVREARTGGFRQLETPSGGERMWWPGVVWVSAGLLLNAALITTIGFILSCTLCYVLAVQGLRRAQGQSGTSTPRVLAIDVATGFLIAAPVFWSFTQFLAINLPGLTSTGWI
ncbi:MAG TPA: tripartite tricarboxylate transporter TctB family protein [Ramlibacter sp.]|uniref:tripartite tricarboxylate transporter TctB family protein n=1 Tax=Ramlibacter sp. TaxID=1917967 RepID=UPI002BA850F3|nr:tripartite tricarboxylate transporter TctB family protein [Ramlibacter sp.]HVZ43484.1 tripartite tricarboxylate transporter TctB family protein [Ramlibacter sp.]